jgi:hypothetical protein
MARLRGQFAQVEGIQGWMQPVQELSIEDKISRTQYQLSISFAKTTDLAKWTLYLLMLYDNNLNLHKSPVKRGTGLTSIY